MKSNIVKKKKIKRFPFGMILGGLKCFISSSEVQGFLGRFENSNYIPKLGGAWKAEIQGELY